MKAFAVIGSKKRGKTTFTMERVKAIQTASVKPVPLHVFDKYGEWGAGKLPPMDDFLDKVQKAERSIAVFEDAGIFFSNRGRSERLEDILTSSRHSKVTTFLLFHSLRALPAYVIEQLDGIELFKTKDNPLTVRRKFDEWPAIYEAWHRVNDAPGFHAHTYIPIE